MKQFINNDSTIIVPSNIYIYREREDIRGTIRRNTWWRIANSLSFSLPLKWNFFTRKNRGGGILVPGPQWPTQCLVTFFHLASTRPCSTTGTHYPPIYFELENRSFAPTSSLEENSRERK